MQEFHTFQVRFQRTINLSYAWEQPLNLPRLISDRCLQSAENYIDKFKRKLEVYLSNLLALENGISLATKLLESLHFQKVSPKCVDAVARSSVMTIGCSQCHMETAKYKACRSLCVNVVNGCMKPLLELLVGCSASPVCVYVRHLMPLPQSQFFITHKRNAKCGFELSAVINSLMVVLSAYLVPLAGDHGSPWLWVLFPPKTARKGKHQRAARGQLYVGLQDCSDQLYSWTKSVNDRRGRPCSEEIHQSKSYFVLLIIVVQKTHTETA